MLNGKAALSGSACVAEDRFFQFVEPQFPHTEEGRGKHPLLGAEGKKLEKWMPKDLEEIGPRAVFKAADRL